MNKSVPWYTQDLNEVYRDLGTRTEGLHPEEAESRRLQYGPNELVDKGGRTPWRILWEQLTATMVLILLAAALIAAALKDTHDAVAILLIVILFALLGFIQEYRAEKAVAALKKLAVPLVRVCRGAVWMEISARELVPGDLIQLEAGNVVPADARLVEAVNLRIQEAALTGESEAVEKGTEALEGEDLPLGDRRNMAYLGTVVSQGRGSALVVATGMKTELGHIAGLIQQIGAGQTPLQQRLDRLGRMLAWVGVGMAFLILVLGLIRGDGLRHMLLTAVSVAVAVIPEGLPAVVTITLALGAQAMLKRKTLIRRLPAVETLGSVTVICSDKTGTLTENRMTVVVMDAAEHSLDLREPLSKASVGLADGKTPTSLSEAMKLMAIAGSLCSDARILEEDGPHPHTLGDPTEGALLMAAAKLGFWKSQLDRDFPRMAELPFDSERKRMTTLHSAATLDHGSLKALGDWMALSFTKGSVDGLLEQSHSVWNEGTIVELDAAWRQRIEASNEKLAKQGMRVLGIALRSWGEIPSKIGPEAEAQLIFLGLFGLMDPPRAEVKAAVETCRKAGIRPVMITGDHPLTAAEIGRQLGIGVDGRTMSGIQLSRLSPEELKGAVEEVSIFARVSPEHKLAIVQALQEKGHIVAMTGDGVNDAPALRRADIGVAMGITGTDVSKEASDLVLLDDNFATIVAAVEQGRVIYDNIRKFVRFSVAGNLGKVLVMLLAPFLGKPIPLLPLQLLWLNLLTDGLLGLGLGVEGPERGVMSRSPYQPSEGVFSRGATLQVLWVGALIGGIALLLGAWYFFAGREEWQTMVFTFLALAQVGQALATRSSTDTLGKLGLFSNPLLAGMVLLVLVLQVAVLYVPFLSAFFQVKPLGLIDLGIALAASALVYVAMEVEKLIRSAHRLR